VNGLQVRSSKQDQIHNSIVSTLLALMDGLTSRGQVGFAARLRRSEEHGTICKQNMDAGCDWTLVAWCTSPSPVFQPSQAALPRVLSAQS
jgi:hypothetical protein